MLLIAWLGWRSISTEQERFENQLNNLQDERLREFAINQTRWIETVEAELTSNLETIQELPYKSWAGFEGRGRFGNQYFAIGSDGELAWPDSDISPLTDKELKFIDLFESGDLHFSTATNEDESSISQSGWITWFEGPGQQWAFWILGTDMSKAGLVIDRTAFMAEVIAQLPDKIEAPYSSSTLGMSPEFSRESPSTETFHLHNEAGEILYSWGPGDDSAGIVVLAETAMPAPLNMWQLRLMDQQATRVPALQRPLIILMASSILGLMIAVLFTAAFLYRETDREFRLARKRVSFVNQVSHEFKTPLTNIQLYSDLLGDSELNDDGRKQLQVIQEETGKLSRMIQNVLTFGRSQRAALRLSPRSVVPDGIIEKMLSTHSPGIERRGIIMEVDLDSSRPMNLDPECLSQILGNLISNAEKYAPNSTVSITSRQTDNTLTVTVRDTGPGIPKLKKESIFEPFVRLEVRSTEGVSGTGIGLSIARELAQLHKGDLILLASSKGAAFQFSLKGIS